MPNGSYRHDSYYRLIILIYRPTSLISVYTFTGPRPIYRLHTFDTRELGVFILSWRATVPVRNKIRRPRILSTFEISSNLLSKLIEVDQIYSRLNALVFKLIFLFIRWLKQLEDRFV